MLGFFRIWDLLHPKAGEGAAARAADQIEFLSREMRENNDSMAKYQSDEIG